MNKSLSHQIQDQLNLPENSHIGNYSRRQFQKYLAFGAAMLSTGGAFAEELTKTPAMTEGPFYPDKLPLDTDNDLIVVNTATTPAVGEITHLSGRILSAAGEPVRNAFVEIWQCDSNGAYLHSGSGNRDKYDSGFQGYGRFLTDSKGRYYFRTIKPVPYTGRTPHIHFAVSQNGRRLLTTQMLVKEFKEQNERDGVFKRIRDPKLRELIVADFKQIKGSKLGELQASYDLIVGTTPEDQKPAEIKGGISKSEVQKG